MKEEVDGVQHISECPEHVDFRSIKSTDSRDLRTVMWLEKWYQDRNQDRNRAYSHHLAELSYYDLHQMTYSTGMSIHDFCGPC